jgi:hypothetical protein
VKVEPALPDLVDPRAPTSTGEFVQRHVTATDQLVDQRGITAGFGQQEIFGVFGAVAPSK